MSLKEDINAGLAAIKNPNNPEPLVLGAEGTVSALEGLWCFVEVPIPESVIKLTNGQLIIKVVLSGTKHFFSLKTILATVYKHPSVAFLEGLLNNQFYTDRFLGVSIGYNAVGADRLGHSGEDDTLAVVYHWMLDSISPEQFQALFQQFVNSSLTVINQMEDIAKYEKNVEPFHKPKRG